MLPAPARRWSKRTLVLTVLGLVLATAVLTVGMVGFARSIGFVTGIGAASEVLNDVGQISPDVTIGGRPSVTPGAGTSGEAVTPPPASAATTTAPRAPAIASSGGGGGEAAPLAGEAQAAGTGGVGGGGGTAGDGGGGGAAGMSGGGSSGAAPNALQGAVQTMLTLLGQNTTQMCGPNTCNVGMVCCNISCGTCVAPGGTCDQTVCAGAARAPTVVRCGSGQCNDGQVCCNPSCGICAAPGETCSTQSCP
ncbi:MAG: hypothetical protein K0R38_4740 [Polyangiaceae bacterium]|jgi:hypothetical protein|nr:hypothetical protein [Polyangiaceae bacterium]